MRVCIFTYGICYPYTFIFFFYDRKINYKNKVFCAAKDEKKCYTAGQGAHKDVRDCVFTHVMYFYSEEDYCFTDAR